MTREISFNVNVQVQNTIFPGNYFSLQQKVIFAFDNCSYNLFSQECFEFQYWEFLLCHFQLPALDKFLFDVKDLKSNLSHAELVPAKQSLIAFKTTTTSFYSPNVKKSKLYKVLQYLFLRQLKARVMVYLIFIAAISIRTWSQLCFGGRLQIRSINMRMTELSTLGWSAVPSLSGYLLLFTNPLYFISIEKVIMEGAGDIENDYKLPTYSI